MKAQLTKQNVKYHWLITKKRIEDAKNKWHSEAGNSEKQIAIENKLSNLFKIEHEINIFMKGG